MNRQILDDQSDKSHQSKAAWLGLGSMTCAMAAMTAAFFSAADPKIALDAARIDAAAALARSGFSWAEVDIEDRVALIRGTAPGEPERVMAYEVVSKALRPAMHESKVVSKVRSQLTLAPRPGSEIPEPAQAALIQSEPPVAAVTPSPAPELTNQRIAAMEPTAAPARSWTAPPVQFPNGAPVMPVTAAASSAPQAAPIAIADRPIETASVDRTATPTPATCKGELAATLASSAIVFARDSYEIEKQSRPTLDKLAGIAKRCSGFHFAIQGHTDGQGSKAHNLALSQRRASAVRTALINRGVDMDRISAIGLGASQPVAQGTGEAALATNRRIEIAVSERKAVIQPRKIKTSKAQTWKTETTASQTSKY
jgi:outer membrane protein OmpA-like peptidoglycan-associated protein